VNLSEYITSEEVKVEVAALPKLWKKIPEKHWKALAYEGQGYIVAAFSYFWEFGLV
jgi:hypothetical protein